MFTLYCTRGNITDWFTQMRNLGACCVRHANWALVCMHAANLQRLVEWVAEHGG
jgi:hypothetical protein